MVTRPLVRMTLATTSPEETRSVAECLGRLCRGGETLLLNGDLGSGKTCFVQGLARGLGVPSGIVVASPTFTIHAEYIGRLVLNHLDLYRLDDPVSQEGLGTHNTHNRPTSMPPAELEPTIPAMPGVKFGLLRHALTPFTLLTNVIRHI